MQFHKVGNDAMTMALKCLALIIAPFCTAMFYFVWRSMICSGKSIPLMNFVAWRALSLAIAPRSDIAPYFSLRAIQASAVVPNILIPIPMRFLVLQMMSAIVHAFCTVHSGIEGLGSHQSGGSRCHSNKFQRVRAYNSAHQITFNALQSHSNEDTVSECDVVCPIKLIFVRGMWVGCFQSQTQQTYQWGPITCSLL